MAQGAAVDPEAARLLKRMTDYIGALKQFGAETEQVFEVVLVSGQKLQFSSASRIVVQRPNKLRAERVGDIISQSFYYDGRVLTLSNPNRRLLRNGAGTAVDRPDARLRARHV